MNTINYRIKSMQVTSSCIDLKYTKEGEMQIHNSLSFTMAVKNVCFYANMA